MSPSPFPQGRTSDEIRRQPRVHQLCGLKAEPGGREHQTADLMENLHPFNLGVRNVAVSKVWSHQPSFICCSELSATSDCWLLNYRHVKLHYYHHLGRDSVDDIAAGYGWTVRGLNPGRGKRFFSSPKYPDRL
jgi:hypothetical protein